MSHSRTDLDYYGVTLRLTLRNTAVSNALSRAKIENSVWVPYIIKAWNAFRSGRSLTLLKLLPSEDRMPDIAGADREAFL